MTTENNIRLVIAVFFIAFAIGCVSGFIVSAFIQSKEIARCGDLLVNTCNTANGLIDLNNKQTDIIRKCTASQLKELGIELPNLNKLDCERIG